VPQALHAYPRVLVELDHIRGAGAEFALRQAGGELIFPQLSLWRLPSATATRLLPELRAAGLLRSVTPDLPLRTSPGSGFLNVFTDPLASSEWWPAHVGAQTWTPPGPGVPLTMIDSGVDVSHPEFSGRPDTVLLNAQSFSGNDGELHGTATASVATAPQNGVGIVGIYPQAKLQLWDASPRGVLTVGDELAGLGAAIRRGRSVINLSLGGFDRIPIEEQAILEAFGAGSLVVASAGNDRSEGSALSYPASFAHVLTIGATDLGDRVAGFSSSSPDLDLAAPGQQIMTAVPTNFNASGYESLDGTSFSAPLVSGAAAAVWTRRPTLTNTQLFEVMRRSASDAGRRGWDSDTGYGILNVSAALTEKAPADDPQEPNEDVYLVKPGGLFRRGHSPLTAPGHPSRVLAAHLERAEDAEDVYRTYLPAKGRLIVTVRPDANVNLQVWGRHTRTVHERGSAAKRDLLGSSARAGRRFDRVMIHGRGLGQYVYVDVFLARGVHEASYRLSAATARR
jgi:subtilase family protein